MEIVGNIIFATWDILKDSAIFILFGFAMAGALKVFTPMKSISKYLGGKGVWPVFKASLIGVPLPLCSCSVLPTAVAMRKMGASKGAVNAFLISTPESGVDSISISYALLDPLMTIFRPLAAFITAFTAGMLENLTSNDEQSNEREPMEQADDSCHDYCKTNMETAPTSRMREGAHFAFVELMDDLAWWMVLGFVTAGVIMVVTPAGWLAESFGSNYVAMPLMLLVGVPMYICATSSTPMAAAMIMKGLSPGAALVFLLAGPATNIGSVMVIRKALGTKSMVVYLASISFCAIVLGVLLNAIYSTFEIDPGATMGAASNIFPESIEVIGAIIFSILTLSSLFRKMFSSTWRVVKDGA